MEPSRIKALIELVGSAPIAELELVEGDSRIRLVRAPDGAAPAIAPVPSAPLPAAPAAPQSTPAEPHAAPAADASETVIAPMPGLFHRAPSPGAPPFVAEGDMVVAGQELCVMEAMKVFSTIRAERPGLIAAILAEDGTMVTVGQPLFRFA